VEYDDLKIYSKVNEEFETKDFEYTTVKRQNEFKVSLLHAQDTRDAGKAMRHQRPAPCRRTLARSSPRCARRLAPLDGT
jgi:hypothetical protein